VRLREVAEEHLLEFRAKGQVRRFVLGMRPHVASGAVLFVFGEVTHPRLNPSPQPPSAA
jgi:hypothetical protein